MSLTAALGKIIIPISKHEIMYVILNYMFTCESKIYNLPCEVFKTVFHLILKTVWLHFGLSIYFNLFFIYSKRNFNDYTTLCLSICLRILIF